MRIDSFTLFFIVAIIILYLFNTHQNVGRYQTVIQKSYHADGKNFYHDAVYAFDTQTGKYKLICEPGVRYWSD